MRGRGEGTIWQHKVGGYAGRVQFEGKKHTVYGKDQAEVRRKLKELIKKLEAGISKEGGSRKLSDWLDTWYASAKQRLAYKTKESYATALVRLKEGLGNYTLAKLRPDKVQQFFDKLATDGVGRRAVEIARNVLRASLNVAVKYRYIEYNPVNAVALPTKKKAPHTLWTHEQVEAFLSAVKGDHLEALYQTFIYLGLRKGEALGLLRENVDLQAGTISVEATLQRRKGEWLVRGDPKTAGSTRTLIIPSFLLPVLKAHDKRQREEFPDAEYFFTSVVGTPLAPDNLNEHFKVRIKRAGVPKVTIHGLRHLAATELIRAGVDVSAVASILGHTNVTTTLNTYTHAFDEAKRAAVRKLEERHAGRSAVRSAVNNTSEGPQEGEEASSEAS